MSISRIVDLKFVYCVECVYRRKVRDVRRHRVSYKCDLHSTPLFGQAGCNDGERTKKHQRGWQNGQL